MLRAELGHGNREIDHLGNISDRESPPPLELVLAGQLAALTHLGGELFVSEPHGVGDLLQRNPQYDEASARGGQKIHRLQNVDNLFGPAAVQVVDDHRQRPGIERVGDLLQRLLEFGSEAQLIAEHVGLGSAGQGRQKFTGVQRFEPVPEGLNARGKRVDRHGQRGDARHDRACVGVVGFRRVCGTGLFWNRPSPRIDFVGGKARCDELPQRAEILPNLGPATRDPDDHERDAHRSCRPPYRMGPDVLAEKKPTRGNPGHRQHRRQRIPAHGLQQRREDVLFLLVMPCIEPHRPHAVFFQVPVQQVHERGFAGPPSADNCDGERRLGHWIAQEGGDLRRPQSGVGGVLAAFGQRAIAGQ